MQAGIDHGYQDRLCIDPLDPECPTLAPNYFNACPALRKFFEWNKLQAESLQINLVEEIFEPEKEDPIFDFTQFIGRRKKRQLPTNATTANLVTKKTKEIPKIHHSLNTNIKSKGVSSDGPASEDYYDDSVDDVKTTTETSGTIKRAC